MAANLGISDDETVKMLIDSFNESCDRHLESLQRAIRSSDWNSVRVDAHTIKGCAANIGADEIFAASRALENAVKEQNTQTCPALLEQLTALCRNLK